jgi:hypothetical protein
MQFAGKLVLTGLNFPETIIPKLASHSRLAALSSQKLLKLSLGTLSQSVQMQLTEASSKVMIWTF